MASKKKRVRVSLSAKDLSDDPTLIPFLKEVLLNPDVEGDVEIGTPLEIPESELEIDAPASARAREVSKARLRATEQRLDSAAVSSPQSEPPALPSESALRRRLSALRKRLVDATWTIIARVVSSLVTKGLGGE